MDILSIYSSAGIDLKPIGERFTAPCPFHREEKPSFIVYPDGGFHCFGCGAHGTLEDLSSIFNLHIFTIKDLEAIKDPLEQYLDQIRSKYESELEIFLIGKKENKIFKSYDLFDSLFIDAKEYIKNPEVTPLRVFSFVTKQINNITNN